MPKYPEKWPEGCPLSDGPSPYTCKILELVSVDKDGFVGHDLAVPGATPMFLIKITTESRRVCGSSVTDGDYMWGIHFACKGGGLARKPMSSWSMSLDPEIDPHFAMFALWKHELYHIISQFIEGY